ncbi:MAG: hypothetical protein AAF485_22370, partial [Chloroflexota bacterium]
DVYPSDVMIELAKLGDDQTPPRRWEVGVWEDQKVFFRPRGSGGRTWAVISNDLQVDGTLENLYNSVYGVYQDAAGRTLRTDTANDVNSQQRYGIVRRLAVEADTTSEAEANIHRDAALNDQSTPTPRGGIEIELLTDQSGAVYPKWMARSGDVVTLKNLSPIVGNTIDKVRTFVLAETNYDVDNNILVPAPESVEPSLEQLVARRNEGL